MLRISTTKKLFHHFLAVSSNYKIIWIVRAFWLVYKCVFIGLWSTKMTSGKWLTVYELREFTVRASYIVFLIVNTENNNFIYKRSKTCCPCLHSPLKTSAKFVRILEQVTLDCVSGFHRSALKFSQTFALVFTRLWRHGKHVLFLKQY